jgi:8-oxo-dGTP diphosphatase
VTEYRNPKPTVDCIIELQDHPGDIVFIERAHPPHGFALPGGYVDEGEWMADAALREAKEETLLDVELIELIELFHVYSDPARDSRQHTVSAVFIGRARGTPHGGDDAARCIVAPANAPPGTLVFDHAVIVADYVTYKQSGRRPPARR